MKKLTIEEIKKLPKENDDNFLFLPPSTFIRIKDIKNAPTHEIDINTDWTNENIDIEKNIIELLDTLR